eukprot:6039212-Amphidinium_carterae.1
MPWQSIQAATDAAPQSQHPAAFAASSASSSPVGHPEASSDASTPSLYQQVGLKPIELFSPQQQSSSGMRPLAVIGMACNFSKASDTEALWQVLTDPEIDCIGNGKDYGRSGNNKAAYCGNAFEFDNDLFEVTVHEAQLLDVQHRMLYQAVYHAMENAYVRLRDSKTSVVFGQSASEFLCVASNADVDGHIALGTSTSASSGR